jgi:2-polyprenyl-3-methyl-5-hydroxy-6-metoxy-1,4-benzoquinol methylase
MTILQHADGEVYVEPAGHQNNHVKVRLKNPFQYSPALEWKTRYPIDLIALILSVKGPAYLCNEIMRDEDPGYMEAEIMCNLRAYVSEDSFKNKRILDFGCGSGASTMIMARHLPQIRVVGVELSEEALKIARARLQYYKHDNIEFMVSTQSDRLPERIGEFDFVMLNAVYEHLLPNERKPLLDLLWSIMKPKGILFISETPYRYWYRESHTTDLLFLNYLPDSVAFQVARSYAKDRVDDQDWAAMLRNGIRGGSPNEILAILERAGNGRPTSLQPNRLGLKNRIDVWAYTLDTRRNGRPRSIQFKVFLKMLKLVKVMTGMIFLPTLDLAIQKKS